MTTLERRYLKWTVWFTLSRSILVSDNISWILSKFCCLLEQGTYYNLISIAGRQIDYAVKEAQRTSNDINDYDLDVEKKVQIEEALEKAKNVSTLVAEFSQPLNNTALRLTEVKERHKRLDTKLDAVDEYVDKARDSLTNAAGGSQIEK